MGMINRSSPMRDMFSLYNFHKDFHILLSVPIIQQSGTLYPMLY